MILLAFFGTLNLILLSRLWLTFKDDGAELKTIIKMGLLPLLSLAFVEMGTPWFLLLGILLISALMMYLTEKRSAAIYRNRAWTLLFHFIALGLIFGFFADAGLNNMTNEFIRDNPLFGHNEMQAFQIYLFGGLLVMNEMNIVLRYVMYSLNLAPNGNRKSKSNITTQQYNTGRIIGLIERIFFYTFAIIGQYVGIGIIFAASWAVRTHEFKDRAFAEYVFIGKLLSTLLAIAVAFVVKTLVE